jgi:DNA-binding protein H-NS
MIYLLQIITNRIAEKSPMTKPDLDKFSLDELWLLHEQISDLLSERILTEKRELEKRLAQLQRGSEDRAPVVMDLKSGETHKRKYPRVFPKYQNPMVPGETWSGRGKQPRWLVAALRTGSNIEDFRISKTAAGKSASGR